MGPRVRGDDNGLLRRGVYHRARRRRDPLAFRNDGLQPDIARNDGPTIGCLKFEPGVLSSPRKRGPIRRGPSALTGGRRLCSLRTPVVGSLLSQGRQEGPLLLPPPGRRR